MFARRHITLRSMTSSRARLRLEALEERWNPANPVVTNTDDGGPGSLRSAVTAVNAAGGTTNTITFNLPADESDINLQSELVISANVTITGPGNIGIPILTIHGSRAGSGVLLRGNRVLTVGEGVSVKLENLELLDGAAPIYDPNGGLIKVLTAGDLTVKKSKLWSGSAYNDGGAIWAGLGSRVTVTDSEIRRNEAGGNGGGIAFANGERLTVTSSAAGNVSPLATILFNDAGLNGGGVWVSGSGNAPSPKVTFSRVSVGGNEAGESGGGFYLTWAAGATGVPVDLTDVSVDANAAVRNFAGGVYVRANTRMTGGAVTRNTARQTEAGIFDPGKQLIQGGNINVDGNRQVIPENPQEPADTLPPTAVYIGSEASSLLVNATINADGAGATTYWNAGVLDLSETEEPRGIGASMIIGNYTHAGSATLVIDLADGGYDQLQVAGAPYLVSLTGGLDLEPHWTAPPAVGAEYTIVRNDTDRAVSGEFAGYPHGYEFWLAGAKLRITYYRSASEGDWNDVILKVITPPATVTGRLFDDGYLYYNGMSFDRDGRQNSGYYGGFANVAVRLRDAAGAVVATTTTNSGGFYAFTLAAGGTFRVEFDRPPFDPGAYVGYFFTRQHVGDDSGDSDVDAAGQSDLFAVESGGTTVVDAGIYLQLIPW